MGFWRGEKAQKDIYPCYFGLHCRREKKQLKYTLITVNGGERGRKWGNKGNFSRGDTKDMHIREIYKNELLLGKGKESLAIRYDRY